MTVYLVILNDRHADVEVTVFANRADAVKNATDLVAEYGYTPDEPDEPVAKWIMYASLSCEGDYVRVEEATVK